MLRIKFITNCYGIVLRWIPQNTTDDKSTLVQVMAWCRHATSHYMSQRSPRSLSPYGVTTPQWVKENALVQNNQSAILLNTNPYAFLQVCEYPSQALGVKINSRTPEITADAELSVIKVAEMEILQRRTFPLPPAESSSSRLSTGHRSASSSRTLLALLILLSCYS